MKFENKVMPNDDQMAEFLEKGNDEPIYMVNLLKFKDKAEYPDKRETDLSGREAYAIYSEEVLHQIPQIYQSLRGAILLNWEKYWSLLLLKRVFWGYGSKKLIFVRLFLEW